MVCKPSNIVLAAERLATRAYIPKLQIRRCKDYLKRVRECASQFVKNDVGLSDNHYVPSNCIVNVTKAIYERKFFIKSEVRAGRYELPPVPRRGVFRILLDFKQKLVDGALALATYNVPMRISCLTAAEMAPAHKVKSYVKVAKGMSDAVPPQPSKYSTKFFMKTEKLKNETVVPRGIDPRDIEANIWYFTWLRPIEKLIYSAIDGVFGSPTVMKGYNAEQTGDIISTKWNKFLNPVFIGFDMSRFDQHISQAALRYEHSVYQSFYPNDMDLAKALKYQLVTNAFCNTKDGYKLRYTTRGGRCSGDANTSLGNTIIMCALLHHFKRQLGFDLEVIDNGDDSGFIFDKRDLYRFNGFDFITQSKLFGFTLKVELPVYTLEKLIFCQCQPVLNNKGHYVMLRNPWSALDKDSMTIECPSNKYYFAWLFSVGTAGCSLNRGMPVFQDFYNMYLRSSDSVGLKTDCKIQQHCAGLYWMSKNMSNTDTTITTLTRNSFDLAFDMPPSIQLDLEEYYRDMIITQGPYPREGHVPK